MKSKKEMRKTNKGGSLKEELINVVKFKEEREKIKERDKKDNITRALSTVGVLGWNLVVPVVLLLIVGKIIVKKFDLGNIWIVNLLFIGLGIGIYNCYKEIKKEYKKEIKIAGKIKETKKENY